MGTRFLPATKTLPKEMLPVIDKPIIHFVIEEAVKSGIEDILIITGRGKRAIEDYFDQSFELEHFLRHKGQLDTLETLEKISGLADIHYIRQKEPMGLGHAILQAKRHVGAEPFAVLLGDEIFRGKIPAVKQLADRYEEMGGTMLGVTPVEDNKVSSYGIIKPGRKVNGVFRVSGLVEKPQVDQAPSNLAIVGRYVIEPQIFDVLENLPPGHNGEVQLTDALNVLRANRKIYATQIEGSRYDVGDKTGYLQAAVEFALERDELANQFRKFLQELIIPGGEK